MALLVFLQLNCKKEDFYKSKINVTEKFFELPPNTDPIIKRIVEDLKQKNALHPFVEQFVKKEGYPVWQYAKISSTQNYSANFTAGEGDTLVSVPVVPDGASYVKDVLKIKMDTELLYKLFVGENYAENGFDKNPDRTEPNADDIVKQIMAFEKEMYYAADSTVIYHIKDNRLFDYWPADTTKPQDFYVALRLDLFEIEYPCILSFTYIVGWAPLNGNVEGGCEPGAPCNPYVPVYNTSTYDGFCIAWVEVGGGGTEGWTSYPEGEPGGGEGTTTPPDSTSNPPNTLPEGCEDRNWVVYVIDTNTGEWKNPCTDELPPIEGPDEYDVLSDPNAPSYPDISENDPPVSLQSLFNCFTQILDVGATYSVKLCVDLPVNGVWNAPFNLTGKSPGHTFLTLTKTNGTQTISQTVGFYPIGSGGTPFNPTATGGFKNNGNPPHQYNAAVNANNISATQFTMVMNNLLSHENDIYNIYNNNCTTLALNAFNLLITPPINCEIFVVNAAVPPTVNNLYFMESPQKLYKAIETFQPGTGLSKEFNVNYDAPLSTQVCP